MVTDGERREAAEKRIRDLLVEIGRVSKEYGTKSYISLFVLTDSGYVYFSNKCCGEDEDTPLNYSEFGVDFSCGESGRFDGNH